MRNVVLALILCNVVYFAWARWIDVSPPPPADAAAKLPPLKLADEVPLSQRPLAQAAKPPPTACVSVGPFADEDNTTRAIAILKDKGFEPKQRAEEGQTQDGYWVFVNLKDQSEIDRALVSLEHGGIRDAIVMPLSPEINGRRLSLGVYTERARAEKRAQAVQGTGLKAQVSERRIPATVYWVDMAPLAGASSVPIDELFAEGVSSKIGVQPCPHAVSGPGGATPTVGVPAAASAPTGFSPRLR